MSGNGLLGKLKRRLSSAKAPKPAPQPAEPSLQELLEVMLVREEGEVLYAYQDHLGYWTIGVGHLIDRAKGGRISKRISRLILEEDTRDKLAAARTYPWFDKLDVVRKVVVVGMIFQLGEAGFANFRNTIKDIAAGRYASAAARMLESLWARQTPERARRMAHMMKTGEWVY